jgi:hypothetical protein
MYKQSDPNTSIETWRVLRHGARKAHPREDRRTNHRGHWRKESSKARLRETTLHETKSHNVFGSITPIGPLGLSDR